MELQIDHGCATMIVRRADRIKCLLKGKIVFNNGNTTIDCLIKNISALGAKIVVGNAVTIPHEFTLEIPLKGKTHRAQLRWRDSQSMGVEFAGMAETTEPDDAHYRRLKDDNIRLKAAIVACSKKLEDLGQDVPAYF